MLLLHTHPAQAASTDVCWPSSETETTESKESFRGVSLAGVNRKGAWSFSNLSLFIYYHQGCASSPERIFSENCFWYKKPAKSCSHLLLKVLKEQTSGYHSMPLINAPRLRFRSWGVWGSGGLGCAEAADGLSQLCSQVLLLGHSSLAHPEPAREQQDTMHLGGDPGSSRVSCLFLPTEDNSL